MVQGWSGEVGVCCKWREAEDGEGGRGMLDLRVKKRLEVRWREGKGKHEVVLGDGRLW